jgi:hypothetical protein
MPSDYKYYINTRSQRYSSLLGKYCTINRWDPFTDVCLDENVEYNPYISVDIDKLKEEKSSYPTSDKFYKVKPILPELFNDYYILFLKTISDTKFLLDDEFYEQVHKEGSYEVQYFAGEGRDHCAVHLKFSNSIKLFHLSLSRSRGYSIRPGWRKHGTPIDKNKFLQCFNLALQFLSDSNSYQIFLEEFIQNFKKIIQGDKTSIGFSISHEQTLSKIIQQLESRKSFIEDRLIKNDNDTQLTRSQLRGELEGILYAIKTVSETL